MMITSISKFMLGTWLLRATNDKYINSKNGIYYIEIYEDFIKFKHIYNKGLIMEKKSVTGTINIVDSDLTKNTATVDIIFNQYNIYSHSIFGIELPELKSKYRNFSIKKKITTELHDNSLLIHDSKIPLYYLFGQQNGKIKSPFIEISYNTFLFSQLVGILLNILFNHI